MVEYRISVSGVRGVLDEVAGNGQALDDAGTGTAAAGDALDTALGNADTVAAALAGFLAERADVPRLLSGRLYASCAAVADTTAAFAAGDQEMSRNAEAALAVSAPGVLRAAAGPLKFSVGGP